MFSSGLLVVIAGPSGAGKTTLAHHLVSTFPNTRFSVSTTTRKPRRGEEQGRDYDFVTTAEFSRRREQGFFLEWAEVHGNSYGTDGNWVRSQLAGGRSVVLDIDVQGAMQVKRTVPSAVLVFVLPGSREELLSRLSGRSTDSAETVSRRMRAAAGEVSALGSFDYFIENRRLEDTLKILEAVFASESRKLRNIGWPAAAGEYHPGHTRGLSWWKGRRVVVSSGPTREMIDDVRFVSNRSSGLMGVSLSEAFLAGGAEVTLVSGPAMRADPPGAVKLLSVESAEEMLEALRRETVDADLLAMAAAVSDYRPEAAVPGKIRRQGKVLSLNLVPTIDVIASLDSPCPVLAFALEYGDRSEEEALRKMKSKGAFAIFLNRGDIPGIAMESTDNSGRLFFSSGSPPVSIAQGSKKFAAMGIAAALGREMGGDHDFQG